MTCCGVDELVDDLRVDLLERRRALVDAVECGGVGNGGCRRVTSRSYEPIRDALDRRARLGGDQLGTSRTQADDDDPPVWHDYPPVVAVASVLISCKPSATTMFSEGFQRP